MFYSTSIGMSFRISNRFDNALATLKRTAPAVAVMELVVALGIIGFWAAYFSTDMVNIADARLKEVYTAFESAFPVADLYLAAVLIAGGVGLLKKRLYGYVFSLMGGASLIFLGLLDVSFNLQQGIYLLGAGEAVLNVSINAMCLGFGVFLVFSVWKNRGKLALPQAP